MTADPPDTPADEAPHDDLVPTADAPEDQDSAAHPS
jgi:hypothetical protein